MKNSRKRLVSAVLSAIIAFGCCVSAFAVPEKFGDVDSSGDINSSDALAVLNHTVGKKALNEAQIHLADVNADGNVNSSDALAILRYTVGIISAFEAESEPSVSFSDNEILALYASAIAKAKDEKPSYKYQLTEESKDAEVNITNALGIPAFTDQKKEMEDELTFSNDYPVTVCKQGSENSYNNLPAKITFTDASKLKSIKLQSLPGGNYKIDIAFKDEIKPSSGSVICQAFGLPDFATLSQTMQDEATIEDIKLNTTLQEMKYSNCWISCVVNPKTNEFVTLDWNVDTFTTTKVVLLYNFVTSVTQSINSSHSDFGY